MRTTHVRQKPLALARSESKMAERSSDEHFVEIAPLDTE